MNLMAQNTSWNCSWVGPKLYSCETRYGCTTEGKVQVKQKGVMLDMSNDEIVNCDTMRDMGMSATE